MTFEFIFFVLVSLVLLVITFVIIYNLFTAPKINDRVFELGSQPFVSILVPARNEEKNISTLIDSILAQSYSNYELILLDDNSEDNTNSIIEEYSKKSDLIKFVIGKPLPKEWTGKNWACFQLFQNSNGELLLFIDADVKLSSNAIISSVTLMESKKIKMLSCFPTQIIKGFGEWLVVPLMNWLLLSFLPLKKVYTSSNVSFAAANGQFILFDKDSYEKIGGHETIACNVVEDMEFVRRMKENKLPVMTALGNDTVYCNMYESFSDAVKGFSKNFFPGFNTSALLFILLLIFFQIIYLLPFVLVFFNLIWLWIIILIIFGRILLSIISNQNIFMNIILHPVQMLLVLFIGINSVYQKLSNRIVWKGRKI